MRRRLTKNMGLKLLSLLVAFAIWLLVANLNNPVKSKLFRDIKIQIINEDSVTEIDKAFDIVSEDSVTIKVTERQSVLDALSADDFTVVADMENLTEMDTVPLNVSCSNSSVTLDEMTIVPPNMKVELEQIVQNDFLVTVETIGTPEEGFEVGTTELVGGKTIQIAGPESLLNRIGQVTATVTVTGLNSDLKISSELSITDKNGDLLSETQMSRLQIRNSEGVLLSGNEVLIDVEIWPVLDDVRILVETEGEPLSGYEVTAVSVLPETVSLVGKLRVLRKLDGELLLADPVSVEGASETFTEDIDLEETLDGIENIRLAQNADSILSVTVQIEKIDSQTIELPLSDLTVKNRPEDKVLTFSPADVLPVTVHDDEGNGLLTSGEIRASVDLAECEEQGDYEIPVDITLPEGYSLESEVVLMVNSAQTEQIEAATEG